MAVVVTVAKGYNLDYIWKTQGQAAGRTTGGCYLNAARAGEAPGRWWGPGAQALGFTPGQVVERKPYGAVYRQVDPRTGTKLDRYRDRYATYADHLARLRAAEAHATAERLIELKREATQATRQPAEPSRVSCILPYLGRMARSCRSGTTRTRRPRRSGSSASMQATTRRSTRRSPRWPGGWG